MRRIFLEKKEIHKGSLVLVNRNHALPRTDWGRTAAISGRIRVHWRRPRPRSSGVFWKENGKSSVSADFAAEKNRRNCISGPWRNMAEVLTNKYVAEPGHSEHESGLAVDLAQRGAPPDLIRPSFPDSGVCRSFRKKAPWFGFIQRYEEGKEAITGIACEPWHFRYVGFPHSLIMQKKGLALEEYLDF